MFSVGKEGPFGGLWDVGLRSAWRGTGEFCGQGGHAQGCGRVCMCVGKGTEGGWPWSVDCTAHGEMPVVVCFKPGWRAGRVWCSRLLATGTLCDVLGGGVRGGAGFDNFRLLWGAVPGKLVHREWCTTSSVWRGMSGCWVVCMAWHVG
eukprot:279309-Chlamydomonas_euryale.AAC.1